MSAKQLILVVIVAAMGSGVALDASIERSIVRRAVTLAEGRSLGEAARMFHRVRPSWILAGGAVVAFLVGLGRRVNYRRIMILIAAAVLANLACTSVKDVVGRPRPWAQGAKALPGIPQASQRETSFPSSHATTVAAVFAMLGTLSGRRAVLPFIAAALSIGCLRVAAGAHFPSDVAAGWGLGTVVVLLADRSCRRVTIGRRGSPPALSQDHFSPGT